MMRLTKANRELLLKLNEGFKRSTYFKNRNIEETTSYLIKGGKLFITKKGKTSWADSHYNHTHIADDEEIHRFLYNFLNQLKKP